MDEFDLESVHRMGRDISKAAALMSSDEARYLVDAYYIMQEDRKRSFNQVRATEGDAEPNSVIQWLAMNSKILEDQIKRALDSYTKAHMMGSWMRDIYGIGPVLSAGLLAHIDITRAPTTGHIWRFAGVDPNVIWPSSERAAQWVKEFGLDIPKAAKIFGRNIDTLTRMATTHPVTHAPVKLTATTLAKAISRRPWNANLKTLCWKIGQSFMKFSNQEECFYGQIYKQRKALEIERNNAGANKLAAEEGKNRVGKDTEAYKHFCEGKLPPAQIDARARRYAVKLFLSHLHDEWYRRHFNEEPPLPYPISFLGHAHFIPAPNASKVTPMRVLHRPDEPGARDAE